MKLNLWLIANRLSNYDIKTSISSDISRPIRNPLPVMASGSLYVHSKGNDVLCYSDQGTILIRDMDEKEGFLLIQSIFNWYDRWLEDVEAALQSGDYRLFVHLCAQAFANPVLLLDSNYLLLGMDCRDISINHIPEWRYIYDKEQSSVVYYLTMSNALKNPVRKYSDYVFRFNITAKDEEAQEYQSSGLHAKFQYLARDYGQITILDKKRALNPGDVALLELLVERSSLIFAVSEKSDNPSVNMRVMNNLLEYKEVSKEQLDFHYSIITKKAPNKMSQLSLSLFRFDSPQGKTAGTELLKNALIKQYPTIYHWIYREDLLVLSYVPEPTILAQQIYSFISSQGYGKKLHMGISLPFDDLRELPCYYEQAVFAINNLPSRHLCFFYDCAYRYFLENTDTRRKLLACEPLCRKLWNEEPEKREFLQTLSVYLSMERSTALAAEYLNFHRNTINYRIKEVKDRTNWDYEDSTLRDYLRLSIYYLMRWGEQ